MPRTIVDTVIVGQGLAGSALAWQLRWRGQSVLLIDDAEPNSASRIAAGLVTPVTGQRLVPSWRIEEFWPAANTFYQRVARETGRDFFRQAPMVRLLQSEAEQQRLRQALTKETVSRWISLDPEIEESMYHNPWGGFEMAGGQLNVPTFLEATRQSFASEGRHRAAAVDLKTDLEIHSDGVVFPRWDVRAERVIFCQGFALRENPWFSSLPFDPAKGEILTIRVPGLVEHRVIHRGAWLAPCGHELFRAGATYDRDHWNDFPTQDGQTEITAQVNTFLKKSLEVVDHRAAVRPIVEGRHPVIGLHPRFPQLGVFNGLGSKGSLQAPFIAGQFADFLLGRGAIETSLDVQKRFGKHIKL